MKTRYALAGVLVTMAACGGNRSAQAGAEPRPMTARDSAQRQLFEAYRGAQLPSVYALIGARERLKLTSPQVTALDSIADAARVQNAPLTDSLRSITGSGNGGPIRLPRGDFQTARAIPMLHRIGDNNRRALDAIQAVLTPDQRTAVCSLAQEERDTRMGGMRGRGGFGGGGGGGRGGGGRGMRGGGMPMMGDSIDGRGGRFGGAGGWPWCARPRGPRAAAADSARGDSVQVRRP
jgi:predicted small lipoprotein YifL